MAALLKSSSKWWDTTLGFFNGYWASFWAKPKQEQQKIAAALLVTGCLSTLAIAYFRRQKQREIDELNEKYDSEFFSHSYSEAREKFFQALRDSDFEEGADYVVHSERIENRARIATFIDFVYFAAKAPASEDGSADGDCGHGREKLFVHVSGTHGVEGYAGSAVQTAIIKSAAFRSLIFGDGTAKMRDQKTHFLFVHALNPTGMALNRRFTQDNIDLNRNFYDEAVFDDGRMTDAMYRVVSSDGDSDNVFLPNDQYMKFAEMIAPPRMPSFYRDDCWFWLEAAYYLARYGNSQIGKAVVTGQYIDEKGLFYGGSFLAPELYVLSNYFKRVLPALLPDRMRKDKTASSTAAPVDKDTFAHVTLVDVHTGLGPPGKDTLITISQKHHRYLSEVLFKDDAEYHSQNRMQCQAAPEGGDGTAVAAAVTTKFDAYQMYAHSFGAVKCGLMEVVFGYDLETSAPKKAAERSESDSNPDFERCLTVTQEFGTVASVKVFKALRNENMAFNNRDEKNQKHSEIFYQRGMDLRSVFYKFEDPYWKRDVLFNGQRLFRKLNGID